MPTHAEEMADAIFDTLFGVRDKHKTPDEVEQIMLERCQELVDIIDIFILNKLNEETDYIRAKEREAFEFKEKQLIETQIDWKPMSDLPKGFLKTTAMRVLAMDWHGRVTTLAGPINKWDGRWSDEEKGKTIGLLDYKCWTEIKYTHQSIKTKSADL